MTKHRGTLISLEGVDGSGKTTQAQKLAVHLKSEGYNPFVFSDPPKTTIGVMVRKAITNMRSLPPLTHLMLASAARSDNYHRYVKPILNKGGIVIMDRFFHSSLVYPGKYPDVAWMLHTLGCGRYPDKVIVLDIPYSEMKDRFQQEPRRMDVLENVSEDVFETRREKFRSLEAFPEVHFLDVSGLTKKSVSAKISGCVTGFLNRGVESPN